MSASCTNHNNNKKKKKKEEEEEEEEKKKKKKKKILLNKLICSEQRTIYQGRLFPKLTLYTQTGFTSDVSPNSIFLRRSTRFTKLQNVQSFRLRLHVHTFVSGILICGQL